MFGAQYWAFTLPIITTALWLADVIGLLALWSRDGFPQYEPNNASFVFISDVGAHHQTWFIIFSVLTGVFFILTMIAERHLRSTARLPAPMKKRQTIYDILCIVFACLAGLFLGLLSGFNDVDYPNVHWSCTLLFILSGGLSVLFQILELFSLSHHHHPSIKHLKWNAIFKSAVLIFAFCVLITFIGLYAECHGDAPTLATNTHCDHVVSGASTMEWLCAFLLSFFFASITIDLLPRNYYGKQAAIAEKRGVHHADGSSITAQEMEANPNQDPYGTVNSSAPPSHYQQPLTEARHNPA